MCHLFSSCLWREYDTQTRKKKEASTALVTLKFDALQEKTETHTLNDEYENFLNAHLEASVEYIPTKQKTKPRVPWETSVVRESVQA